MLRKSTLTTAAAALVVLTVGAAPFLANAADHLDAPALGRTVVAGQIAPHSSTATATSTTCTCSRRMTPPTAPRSRSPSTPRSTCSAATGANVRAINIDTNGDLVADLAYVGRFETPAPTATRSGSSAATPQPRRVAQRRPDRCPGATNGATSRSARTASRLGRVRSDPFFDLTGFIGTTTLLQTGTAVSGDGLGNNPTDFFAHLNTNAIVITPRARCSRTRSTVWRRRVVRRHEVERRRPDGPPAINTVFNPSADKNLFNATRPASSDRERGKFFNNVVNTPEVPLEPRLGGRVQPGPGGGARRRLIPTCCPTAARPRCQRR
jgi:hypothetical protein